MNGMQRGLRDSCTNRGRHYGRCEFGVGAGCVDDLGYAELVVVIRWRIRRAARGRNAAENRRSAQRSYRDL